MPEPHLTGEELERLRRAPLTYAEVGCTRGQLPAGYHHLHRTATVGTGAAAFEQAARTVLGWEMHRRAGLSVRPSDESAVEGAVAVIRLGLGPLGINAPIRVVYHLEEPRRRGFAYGTLPGHPESGEEAFVVELGADDEVRVSVTAFSRSASMLARVSGPLSRAAQGWAAGRYVAAVRQGTRGR